MADKYNWDRYTTEQLVQMEAEACKAPKRNERRIDAIRWEIHNRNTERRRANGEYISEAGYTGRNSNRRR